MDNPAPASASNIPSDNPVLDHSLPGNVGPRVSVDQLLLAGAHFGHLTQRWNPKMKRFIFMARNGIYLIDLQKTQVMLEAACAAISKIATTVRTRRFVSTARDAGIVSVAPTYAARSTASLTQSWGARRISKN